MPAHRAVGFSALLCAAVMIAVSPASTAQQIGNRGTDFWLAFMPNVGSNGADEVSRLSVYVAGTVGQTVTFTFTQTGESRTVRLESGTAEVNLGTLFGNVVELRDAALGDEVSRKSIHVTTDRQITLIGANVRLKSADAFLALPVHALAGRYLVLAWPNGFAGATTTGDYDMPSQFAVVATADSTVMDIYPAPGLTINKRAPERFTVTLSRGAVYFAQADLLKTEQDVTGTRIESNKPVAVFAGAKRTAVPTELGNFRDHLVEQLPPVDRWSNMAVLTPHAVVSDSRDTSVVRIIATRPNTLVSITGEGGEHDYTVGPSQVLELPLLSASVVEAQGPILAAQFERSSSASVVGNALGDPFMMLALSPAQYTNAYTFHSMQDPDIVGRHFVNVIIGGESSAPVMLDGKELRGDFRPIAGTNASYAQVEVNAGWHTIVSDVPFGLYVYGFGASISYGYPGGLVFDPRVGAAPGMPGGQTVPALRALAGESTAGEAVRFAVDLPCDDRVSLVMIDLRGAPVRAIASDLPCVTGTHRFAVDAAGLPSGTYLVRLVTATGFVATTKANIVR